MILESNSTDFDPEKFYLGTLCSRGHDWDGTGRSLRYKSTRSCTACVAESQRCWHHANPDKVREKNRRWWEADPRRRKVAKHRRRARKVAALVIPYTGAELAAHFSQFDGCAYCGASEQTVDHLFPLSHDLLAADALFNVVPACGRCNSSKNNRHPVQWYRAQAFYDPARLQRIIDVLGIGEP